MTRDYALNNINKYTRKFTGQKRAMITLVILANYVPIRWHRSAYLWSPSFVCRSVISSLSKGKHAYPTLPPTGVYWFSFDLFRYQCIVRLSIWLNKLVAQNRSLCDYGEGVIKNSILFCKTLTALKNLHNLD